MKRLIGGFSDSNNIFYKLTSKISVDSKFVLRPYKLNITLICALVLLYRLHVLCLIKTRLYAKKKNARVYTEMIQPNSFGPFWETIILGGRLTNGWNKFIL